MIKKIFLTIITLLFIQTITNAATIKFVQVTDSHYIANNQYRSEILQKAINNINDEKDIAFVVFITTYSKTTDFLKNIILKS